MVHPTHWHSIITYIVQGIKYSNFSLQMFGRAGRGGGPAWAHLYYTKKQAETLKDASLQCFASPGRSENCRRQQMLSLLGSNDIVASNEACYNICSGGVLPSQTGLTF